MDLRSLPKVDALSRSDGLRAYPERVRIAAAQKAIEEMRAEILAGEHSDGLSPEARAEQYAHDLTSVSMRRVINLSGVLLHTGLGRARLAAEAQEQIAEVAKSHAALELDLETGARGDRQLHVRALLRKLSGAEDALVVNNAAAGVLLALSAVAAPGDVLLSRGEMVEIGGAFRMPDIVGQSGCRLVEVGCTNKTHLADYESALSSGAGAILRCHRSNFEIVGFTEQPALGDLVRLAHAYGIPLIDDMGTGCLVDTTRYGLAKEPTISDSVRAGADLVIASGDKLLGGPQAGVIVGKANWVERARRHPLARAVRMDKLTLAGLEATLRLYDQGREEEIPTIRYLARNLEEVREFAVRLAACVKASTVAPGMTQVGGGSAPGAAVPTWRVGVSGSKPDALARRLRLGEPSIVGRIEHGIFWLDPRTLDESEVDEVCEVLKSL